MATIKTAAKIGATKMVTVSRDCSDIRGYI